MAARYPATHPSHSLKHHYQAGAPRAVLLQHTTVYLPLPPHSAAARSVESCTARMLNSLASLDTIVAINLHADILSDLAGSLAISPTGNIDPERRYPSMFEPVHGSVFDIMGKGLANPVGTFRSCVMLLEHLGEAAQAQRLMQAIEAVTANPALHTRDLGGASRTEEITDAVCRLILKNEQG